MQGPLRGLLAGAAAWKFGGGCISTILIFILVFGCSALSGVSGVRERHQQLQQPNGPGLENRAPSVV